MREAQFGDFANDSQCIIDQFIAAGERKWVQRSGLVMSLPREYDGQGPEHSSGRIERFLQQRDDYPDVFPPPEKMERMYQDCNAQIVYPTTPANYSHVLRRQVYGDFRKPLILFFSKFLLRHPLVKSDLSEMTGKTHFQRYLPDPHPDELVTPDQIRRHIIYSGQVCYILLKARDERGIKDIAISRLEQLSPFPYNMFTPHLNKYPNAELIYAQEEPLDCGAWTYVASPIRTASNETRHHKGTYPKYARRHPTSLVAAGSKLKGKKEVELLINDALA
ncbi:2-oxoglutarate dehydrogenase E1 component [Ceratobasidium sp. 395]|nr:2-oxoglutarate dehydrogenase E1 component [Ceratobasidium sp. 395]